MCPAWWAEDGDVLGIIFRYSAATLVFDGLYDTCCNAKSQGITCTDFHGYDRASIILVVLLSN